MSRFNNSLLWEITNTENNKISYLFGTMHAKSKEAFTFYHHAEKHLMKCKVFSSEIDLNTIDHNPASILLPKGQNLTEILSSKQYDKLEGKLKRFFNFDLNQYNHYKPMIIQNMVLVSTMHEENSLALDFQLKSKAEIEGLKITGIETFQEQCAVLDKISLDYQIKMLTKMLQNYPKSLKNFERLVKCYEKADLIKLYKLTSRSLGALRKDMLYNRNKLMAERICKSSILDSSFFAIGAAHLGGKKGVLRYLSTSGLLIKPV
jgi:uncharacterized protein YbaP (TraB family)